MADGPTRNRAEGQRVFVSYRRLDCQAQANGLYDGLRNRLKSASIFMDLDSIPPGVDFEQHIRAEIQVCDVLLVLIGDDWLNARGAGGGRRIDESEDFVRLEIESALASNRVRVIPVLVEGAEMPRAGELPESIRRLARINAIELNDRRWISDVERLVKLIESLSRQPGQTDPPDPPRSAQGQQVMRLADVQGAAVAGAIGRLPGRFQTGNVAGHPDVLRAHGSFVRASNYQATIGVFISRNAVSLAVRAVPLGGDVRDEWWERVVAPPPQGPPGPGFALGQPRPPPVPTTFNPALLLIALPLLCCGLLAWVPPVWAAVKTKDNPGLRNTLYAIAAGCVVSLVVGGIVFESAPENAQGTKTGVASYLGMGLMFLAVVAGTWVAIAQRNAGASPPPGQQQIAQLPGVGQALAKRQVRHQYRDLARRDPGLARDIWVGRPDKERAYDDGGLLDLNSLTAAELAQYGPMSPEEAQSIVAARERFGRLSSVEDLIVYADLQPRTVDQLREYAIFV